MRAVKPQARQAALHRADGEPVAARTVEHADIAAAVRSRVEYGQKAVALHGIAERVVFRHGVDGGERAGGQIEPEQPVER